MGGPRSQNVYSTHGKKASGDSVEEHELYATFAVSHITDGPLNP